MEYRGIGETLNKNRFWVALVLIVLCVAGASVYVYIRIATLDERLGAVSRDLASTTNALYQTRTSLSNLGSQTVGISQTLSSTKEDVAAAKNTISAVKNQVGGVEQTVGSISGSVSTLQKLVATDPELLRKYSKVYFLNENYTPAHLNAIPQEHVYSNTQQELFLTEAQPFLQKMLAKAKADGVTLYVDSAYRSFSKQQKLKSEYTVVYGAGTANSFSADQGYSEHQLGTTVDFITTGMGGQLSVAFDSTASFKWLKDNAYKFGFQLSYPKGNAYYIYEPWHWRFVGVKLATYLHDHAINFYDMDQRDVDAYLANLFD